METVNRRTAARLLAGFVAAPVLDVAHAQEAPPSQGSDADLQAAREGLRRNTEQISKVKLPMATEPAFRFRA